MLPQSLVGTAGHQRRRKCHSVRQNLVWHCRIMHARQKQNIELRQGFIAGLDGLSMNMLCNFDLASHRIPDLQQVITLPQVHP